MKTALIACEGFRRELEPFSPENALYLPQIYHDDPEKLHSALQSAIDRLEESPGLEIICLCYPLCGGAALGLVSKKVPLILPKAHDCMDLLMACSQEFRDFRKNNPGSFYYTPSWIDFAYTPSKKSISKRHRKNAKLYGKEAAEFLSDQNTVLKNYIACVYLQNPFSSPKENRRYIRHTKKAAAYLGFTYRSLFMDLSLLKCLAAGETAGPHVSRVPPGRAVAREDYI